MDKIEVNSEECKKILAFIKEVLDDTDKLRANYKQLLDKINNDELTYEWLKDFDEEEGLKHIRIW